MSPDEKLREIIGAHMKLTHAQLDRCDEECFEWAARAFAKAMLEEAVLQVPENWADKNIDGAMARVRLRIRALAARLDGGDK